MRIINYGLGHGPEWRWAEFRALGACLLLIAALTGGCAHSQKSGSRGGMAEAFSVPQTPAFLNGPMALLLTNVAGFRAHAELDSGVGVTEGELMGRGGKLMFAPGPSRSAGKRSGVAGSAFIWGVTAKHGCPLNAPLPGYAGLAATPPPPPPPVHQPRPRQRPQRRSAREDLRPSLPTRPSHRGGQRRLRHRLSPLARGGFERPPGPHHPRLGRSAAHAHLDKSSAGDPAR